VRICKPNLVCPRPGPSRGRGEVIIYLGRPSPTVSSGLPAPMDRRAAFPSGEAGGSVLLGLTPRGVCRAAPVTRSAGALLPHPFTPDPTGHGPVGAGLLSVARAVTGSRGREPAPSR